MARTLKEAARYRQLTYTCLDTFTTRQPEWVKFPTRKCAEGIMTSLRFPTCWDGKNLDSPDHMAHMSYPETGTFESNGTCPTSHPVRTAQVMYEVVWGNILTPNSISFRSSRLINISRNNNTDHKIKTRYEAFP